MAIVAVDLHGTIADRDRDSPTLQDGAVDALTQLQDAGHHVAVWTCWNTDKAEEWLNTNNVPFDSVNEAPERFDSTSPKLDADAYVDDKAVLHTGDWEDTIERLQPMLVGKSMVRVKGVSDDASTYVYANGPKLVAMARGSDTGPLSDWLQECLAKFGASAPAATIAKWVSDAPPKVAERYPQLVVQNLAHAVSLYLRRGKSMATVTKRMKGVQIGEPSNRVATYVMTSTSEDRDGETVDPLGWDFDEYALNPTVQFNHDTDAFGIGSMSVDLAGQVPEGQKAVHPKVSAWNEEIGEGTRWPQVGGPKRMALLGNVYFSKVGDVAEEAFRKVEEGTLKGASISFAPTGAAQRNAGGCKHYGKWKLLEFTICPVGSNPDAVKVKRAKRVTKSGRFEVRDADGNVLYSDDNVNSALYWKQRNERAGAKYIVADSRSTAQWKLDKTMSKAQVVDRIMAEWKTWSANLATVIGFMATPGPAVRDTRKAYAKVLDDVGRDMKSKLKRASSAPELRDIVAGTLQTLVEDSNKYAFGRKENVQAALKTGHQRFANSVMPLTDAFEEAEKGKAMEPRITCTFGVEGKTAQEVSALVEDAKLSGAKLVLLNAHTAVFSDVANDVADVAAVIDAMKYIARQHGVRVVYHKSLSVAKAGAKAVDRMKALCDKYVNVLMARIRALGPAYAKINVKQYVNKEGISDLLDMMRSHKSVGAVRSEIQNGGLFNLYDEELREDPRVPDEVDISKVEAASQQVGHEFANEAHAIVDMYEEEGTAAETEHVLSCDCDVKSKSPDEIVSLKAALQKLGVSQIYQVTGHLIFSYVNKSESNAATAQRAIQAICQKHSVAVKFTTGTKSIRSKRKYFRVGTKALVLKSDGELDGATQEYLEARGYEPEEVDEEPTEFDAVGEAPIEESKAAPYSGAEEVAFDEGYADAERGADREQSYTTEQLRAAYRDGQESATGNKSSSGERVTGETTKGFDSELRRWADQLGISMQVNNVIDGYGLRFDDAENMKLMLEKLRSQNINARPDGSKVIYVGKRMKYFVKSKGFYVSKADGDELTDDVEMAEDFDTVEEALTKANDLDDGEVVEESKAIINVDADLENAIVVAIKYCDKAADAARVSGKVKPRQLMVKAAYLCSEARAANRGERSLNKDAGEPTVDTGPTNVDADLENAIILAMQKIDQCIAKARQSNNDKARQLLVKANYAASEAKAHNRQERSLSKNAKRVRKGFEDDGTNDNDPIGLRSLKRSIKGLEDIANDNEYGPVKEALDKAIKLLKGCKSKAYGDDPDDAVEMTKRKYFVKRRGLYVSKANGDDEYTDDVEQAQNFDDVEQALRKAAECDGEVEESKSVAKVPVEDDLDEGELELKTDDPPHIQEVGDGYAVKSSDGETLETYPDKEEAVKHLKKLCYRKRLSVSKRLSKADGDVVTDAVEFLDDAASAGDTPKRLKGGMMHHALALKDLTTVKAKVSKAEDELSDDEQKELDDAMNELENKTKNLGGAWARVIRN